MVVGPNGSGKSNLVDALSWVLGTQSTKTLRTPKMEDVIFAGTATRPALNRAEATLVIDNAERQIDLDLDEVAITRRLYRDGSSDYELNGLGCRLLDIQDLLSDSGVGRHQHVIIGQGEIGKVLNASPEEHRAVIEEAAGILKHRRRKERAERRLERTDDDMIRLQDLLVELSRQMRPLKRQARAAGRYDGLKAEATALRLYLGGQSLGKHDRDLTIATSERARLLESVDADQRSTDELGERLSRLTETARQVGGDLDRDTSAAAILETTLERIRRIGSVAHERSRAMTGRREAVVERIADLGEEKDAITEELATIASQSDQARAVVEASEARFRRLEDEERAVATQNALSPEGAIAAIHGELSALQSALIRDERERAGLMRRLDVLSGRRRHETAEVERINEEVKKADEEISEVQAIYEQASKTRVDDQHAWEEAEEGLHSAKLAIAAATARVEAVGAALEGRFDGAARQVAESSPGVLGSLVSQLDVPEGLEAAVESALGRWADALAFGEIDAVRGAVEQVKASGGGAVPVVSAISDGPAPAREVADSVGVNALIDRLGPAAHSGLATRLLGDVLLVEGWKIGWDLVARHPALKAVTPEGDLITVSGVHIANPDEAGAAMLEAAEVTHEQASTELARAESIHTGVRRDFGRSRKIEREALERLEAVEAALAGRSEAMGHLQETVKAIDVEAERLEERKTALAQSMEDTNAQVKALRGRLESLEGEEAARVRVWEELEGRRLQLAAEREVARSSWQEAEGNFREIVERTRLLEERLKRITEELSRLGSGDAPDVDPRHLEAVKEFSRRAATILERRVEELRDRQARLREESATALDELEIVRTEHDAHRSAIAEAKDRVAQIDIRLTEVRLHREAVIEAIRRDADAGIEVAMKTLRPDVPEDADLDELLESKLAQLSRLGPINPLAAEEYRELDERHTFQSEQMADVESSRAELRKVISVLEEEIEHRFADAFSEVAEAYQRYFEVLFPGGRGQIRMEDAADHIAGVLIDAQPLGKKVSQMTLLSGGERSLAALAFLFAIFDARPSPFYVLDEVEAALDDTNLRRFLRIVDQFRQRAQLIIVTHQQQTMEAADVLYGVTMEPGGSSQAVRKDMTGAVADLSAVEHGERVA